ncbi:MAG: zinc carboxypeptidase, partial [Candidatus Marinimicrobia bacterium]|nr:zinc carboxypeptidase [Candidatus Neomarinimicrobiota bacterium]
HGLVSTSKSIKGFSYLKGKTEQLKVSKGDIIISAKQSKSVLVQILFEPQTTLRDTMTYDITAWAIPYVFGLKSYAVKSDVKFSKARYFKPKYEIVDKSPYAYLLPWEGINDVRFLANLFKNDIVSRVSEEPFSIEGREFNRGTLVITRKGNEKHDSKFDEIIKNAGKKYDRRLFTVNTGFVTKGKDFGSSSMRVVKRPKIGLVSGDGVSSSRYGEVWHYFERQIEFPVTVLGTDYFMQIPKHNFDILIFPGGGHNYLDRDALIELRSWVRSGGKLIVMDSSLDKFVDQKGFGLKKYATDVEKESSEKRDNERELSERLRHYKDRQRSELSQNAYGSIIKIKMDKSHPLAFGYGDEYFSLKLRNNRYAYLHNGWNVGTVADSTSIVSGFVGYKAQENFRESMVFGVEDIGRGSIIYMADNPLFRGFWYNGKLLFANAIFIVGN